MNCTPSNHLTEVQVLQDKDLSQPASLQANPVAPGPQGRVIRAVAGLVMILSLCGCMQIDTHVKLNEDGSAVITEKVRFSRRLLELSGAPGSDTDIAGLLTQDTALARAKHMGKGCTLTSYKVNDAEGGSKEAIAVYKIDDLAELEYVSPFLAFKDYDKNNAVKFVFSPKLQYHSSRCWAGGEVGVELQLLKPPVSYPRIELKPGEKPPPGPAPKSLQMFRDLEPMFQDMFKDFKVKLTFESYDKLHSLFGIRGAGAGAKSIDFINVTDKDLDRYGTKFFENEEVMLEIIQGKFNEDNIAANCREWHNNLTVPVFHNWGSGSKEAPWRSGNEVLFRPSQALFKRFFEGKTIETWSDVTRSAVKKPANFDEIGFKPDK
jgi:hypothetical protein